MIVLLLAGCLPDDWTGYETDTDAEVDTSDVDTSDIDTSDPDTQATGAPDPALVGTWVSTGTDRSPLFVQLGVQRVEATFRADGSYVVTSRDGTGDVGTFTGTYAVSAGNPAGIVLQQSTPYTGRAEGLYEVANQVLTYETVQTIPDYGNAPPSGSFGTSTGGTLSTGDNVQTYRVAP